MLAYVTLPVGNPHTALLVPKDALVLGGPSPLVYVVEDDSQTGQSVARAVAVSVGVADGPWIQVTGSLTAGQRVVVQGNERLRSGAPVQPKLAATIE